MRFLITRLLRLVFQALYYPLAPLYDKISYYAFLGQWSKWQRAVIPNLQGKSILEIGCGTGSLYLELLKRGGSPVGLDASRPMLRQARRKLQKAGKQGHLVLGKVQHLPFPDETFTSVISTFPTEYILDITTLKEITRVLYPGGRLIVVDTARLKPFNRRARLLLWFYEHILGYGGKPADPRLFEKMRLLFVEAGLVRRDDVFEDEQGEAHIIIGTKVW